MNKTKVSKTFQIFLIYINYNKKTHNLIYMHNLYIPALLSLKKFY